MSTADPALPSAHSDDAIPQEAWSHDGHYEIVSGTIVLKPHMGVYETHVASLLAHLLGHFAWTNHLGRVESEMLFALGEANRLSRRPAMAYVAYDRWPRERRVPRASAWKVIPDLAVEVISPSNKASEVLAKVHDYLRAGVQVVWVVYPNEEMVYRYRSPTDVIILTRSGTLEAPELLPGFRLPLDQLFEQAESAE